MSKYTPKQVDILLDMFFRRHERPAPWAAIAGAMGVEATPKMLERLLWAVVTGYGSRTADGRRRDALPPCVRRRSGLSWLPREDHALRMALGGEGRQRTPPCDADYISAVLRRTPEEVVQRWDQLNSDALSREGFFK